MKDPFVDEVRQYRLEHTRRFNNDLHLICEDLKQFELTLGKRLVTLTPRRIQRKNNSSSTKIV